MQVSRHRTCARGLGRVMRLCGRAYPTLSSRYSPLARLWEARLLGLAQGWREGLSFLVSSDGPQVWKPSPQPTAPGRVSPAGPRGAATGLVYL